MNITKIGPFTRGIQYQKSQNVKNLKQQNNSTNTINFSNKYEMPIVAPNYFSKNISFGGKLDWKAISEYSFDMGKRIYSKRNVTELAQIHKGAEGISMGNGLPAEWIGRIKNLANFDKDSFIIEFGEIFEKEREWANIDVLTENLTKLFKKHGIIDDKTPLSAKYIGHGFQAWAYRIGIGEDKSTGVVTKLFKRRNNFLQNHGNHSEQNLAEYVTNYAGDKSEFVKYNYGDTKHALMTVDYLPPTVEAPKHKLDLSDIGLCYGDDFPKNRINGNACDFGGLETFTNLIGNNTAQEVHYAIKYAKTPEEKIELFNKIIATNDGSDEFKDKAIGLTHSIKHMPRELQAEMYQKCYDVNSHRVNIALIQNIKNFSDLPELKPLIKKLTTNVDDIKAQETIAKEIKYIPDDLRHKFFEEYMNTKHSAIIKYLARNINQYYRDMPNRVNIYRTFAENADPYASVALINSMKYMGSSRYDEYFEKFFSKNDVMINTSLARSIDLFNETPELQQKWINKLLTCDDVRVKTGLSEALAFINEDFKLPLFEKLLDVPDKVCKEFLATNITSIPGYNRLTDLVTKLLDGADNIVRGAFVNTVKKLPDSRTKETWLKMALDGADSQVSSMITAKGNI